MYTLCSCRTLWSLVSRCPIIFIPVPMLIITNLWPHTLLPCFCYIFSVVKSGQCPSILEYGMPSLRTPSVIKSSMPSSPPLVLKHSTQYPCTPTVVRSSALSLCSQEQCAIPTHSHHTWEYYTALLFLYMARCCSILKNTTNCQPLM